MQWFSRTLSYDDEGLLARCEVTLKNHDGVQVSSQTLVFTWEDGNVVSTLRAEKHMIGDDPALRMTTDYSVELEYAR